MQKTKKAREEDKSLEKLNETAHLRYRDGFPPFFFY
jgi:hypothetical protein